MPISDSSILNEVALMTDLFSGADLANVVKEVILTLSNHIIIYIIFQTILHFFNNKI